MAYSVAARYLKVSNTEMTNHQIEKNVTQNESKIRYICSENIEAMLLYSGMLL